ncbi:probable pectinesterase 53 [Physcomitrium patens]|uniref:Pectinesterase n=1 Tax=Physcomitrium patens TaxID=3218 RepID=A0A2K1KWW5_PHYPA|nr:probable pectinesterase 53 [Physcomitrium patens]PNR58273.1 hypothetical protein PHYPA_005268 [Physcomitrium patens]|eukprot:XP_024372006.1 probable pectinesterase 53 [Physcomitrella patens]
MSLLHVTIIAILLVSFPPTITCSRHRLDNHQSTEQIADRQPLRPARDDLASGEFAKWVKRIGEKHMRKQAMRAKAKNNPQLLDLDPSTAEPDLSEIYPGMKQYLDWESVVSSATYIIVDQNGLGQFTGISAALDSIPSDIFRRYRITIQVNAGIYREKVYIGKDKPFITMVGIGNPVIVWDDNKTNANNRTFESATFGVGGDFFMAVNMTFQNSAPAPESGAIGMQAVALRITSDVAVFYRCSILGNQDSLYDHNGRHFFKECFIQGSIDFIFGDGLSIYYRCELNVVPTSSGAVTAQKRQNATDNSGFSFQYCWITGGAGQVYLGRAWGPFSRVVYSFTWMNDIIYAPGWYDWGNYTRQATVYYGQYKCTGPGANQAGRVAWSHELTDLEVVPFLSLSFVDGEAWVPQNMRPVEGGL